MQLPSMLMLMLMLMLLLMDDEKENGEEGSSTLHIVLAVGLPAFSCAPRWFPCCTKLMHGGRASAS
jgi:hypothetical protein